jgi:hypothetical protein
MATPPTPRALHRACRYYLLVTPTARRHGIAGPDPDPPAVSHINRGAAQLCKLIAVTHLSANPNSKLFYVVGKCTIWIPVTLSPYNENRPDAVARLCTDCGPRVPASLNASHLGLISDDCNSNRSSGRLASARMYVASIKPFPQI